MAAVVAGGVGFPRLDPVVALAVGGVVAWRGWGVVRGAAEVLTDAAAVDTDAIRASALAVAGVRDCHAVRSRGEAGHVRVDLRIHVAPDLTIVEGHRIAEAVEAEIRQLDLGIAEVLVTSAPIGRSPDGAVRITLVFGAADPADPDAAPHGR
ncbi:MAG TPA: cation transporter dimerization domain-containing protein [Candidatus Limnocylindria bacterium]